MSLISRTLLPRFAVPFPIQSKDPLRESDRIPFASTLTNGVKLFLKCAIIPFSSPSTINKYSVLSDANKSSWARVLF